MEQFNLEKYLKNPSRRIMTRDGRKARILCTDAKGEYPIIALIESFYGNEETPGSFSRDGSYLISNTRYNDLFFAPEKHEGWVSIYRGVKNDDYFTVGIFDSEEKAKERGGSIATVKVEWEN